jgi:hypothetical protein
MSAYTPASGPEAARSEAYDDGSGWVAYAGVLILMAGGLNIISGVGAIDDARFFVNGQEFVISDLHTWGWVQLALGVILVLTAVGVFARNALAVWTGVVLVALNAMVQILFIPASPWWAISVLALDMLALYGLVAHGTKPHGAH